MVFKFSKSDDSPNQQLNRKIKKLDTFNKIKVCTGYELDGGTLTVMPNQLSMP